MSRLKAILKNRFISNMSWLLFSQVFYLGISFFVAAYAARVLGPEMIGIMDYSNNYISVFLVICTLGMDTIVIRQLVSEPQKKNEILGSAFAARTVAASIIAVLFVGIMWVAYGNSLTFLVALIQIFLLFFKLYSVYDLFYQSKLQSKELVKTRCIATSVVAVLKVVSLSYKPDLITYTVLCVGEHLLCYVLASFKFRKTGIRMKYQKDTLTFLMREGVHFILSELLVIVYTRIDKLMLAMIKGNSVLGVYSVAVTISELWTIVPQAIITSARPIIIGVYNEDEQLFEKKMKQLIASVFFLGIAVAIVIGICSSWIIQILYGPQYMDAQIPMIILSFGTVFALLGNVRGVWIVSTKNQRYTKHFTGIAAMCNVVLNALLMPQYGMIGVAVATLVSQILGTVIAPVMFKETRRCTILMIQAMLIKDVVPWGKRVAD